MRYRTKLTLLFAAVVLVSNGLLFTFMYVRARDLLTAEMRSKVMSIAATAAAMVDAEQVEKVRAREDEGGEAYNRVESKLRAARDANRRDDTFVKFLYTARRAPADPGTVQFLVDPEESLQDKSHVGDVYKAMSGDNGAAHLYEPGVPAEIVTDQWGTWLTAHSPVYDAQGNPVAAVGVDVAASDVMAEVHSLLYSGLLFLGLSVAAAVGLALFLARRVARPLHELQATVERIGKGEVDARVPLPADGKGGADEFVAVGRAVNAMAVGLRERGTLKEVLAKYLSRQVAESVINSGQVPQLHGDRRKVTVLFADIRGFTQMSDGLAAEQVVGLLNEYFEKMIEVIFKHHGTLDKFIGDGLMAVFGAPIEDPYQERHAITAALEMQHALAGVCRRWQSQGRTCPDLKVAIGVNTGMAVVGNIGSSQRMEYTAIGDTVNLASRLESQAKTMDVGVLISEYTYVEVRNTFRTKAMGSVPIRGRADPVTVYAVEDRRESSRGDSPTVEAAPTSDASAVTATAPAPYQTIPGTVTAA